MNYSRQQLYALGEPLGESVTRKVGGKTIYGFGGGGGGSSAPTSQTITQTNLPQEFQPEIEGLVGGLTQQMFQYTPTTNASGQTVLTPTGFTPYQAFGQTLNPAGQVVSASPQQMQSALNTASQAVAGFSPLQQQSFQGAAGLQTPGQFGAASQMAGQAAYGSGMAGQQYAQQATNPYATAAYMSPYMQNVVDVQQQNAQRQADIANQGLGAQFAQSGAFGGGRFGVQQAQNAQNLALQKQNIEAQGLQSAFQNAQANQQFGAQLGLQGLGQQGQLAGTLGGLGTQQLAAQQGILGLQNQLGAQQQQQQQNIINQAIQNFANAQQYPWQMANNYNAILRGYAVPGQTTTQYQAPPSMASQLVGLGTAGVGLSKLAGKAGGSTKDIEKRGERFAGGGIASLNSKVLENPYQFSAPELSRAIQDGAVNDLIGYAGLNEVEQRQKEMQGMKAAQQPPQPPVSQQLLAAAQQPAMPRGLDSLPSNLPRSYAPGGIVAFDDGGEVPRSGQGYTPQSLRQIQAAQDAEIMRQQEEQARAVAAQSRAGAPQSSFQPISPSDADVLLRRQQQGRAMMFPPGPPASPSPATAFGTAPAAPAAAPSMPPALAAQVSAQGPATTIPDAPAPAATPDGPRPGASAGAGAGSNTGIAALIKGINAPRQYTAAELTAMEAAQMPQGARALEGPLSPMMAAHRRESERDLAEQGRGLSELTEQQRQLRAEQTADLQQRKKNLERSENELTGHTLLSAASQFFLPGQTFGMAFGKALSTGSETYMKGKEKIDERAEKLSDAMMRVKEAGVGDKREQMAAQRDLSKANAALRSEMITFAQHNFDMNKSDAVRHVDRQLGLELAANTATREKAKIGIEALLGSEKNAIARAELGLVSERNAIARAELGRNPTMEMYKAMDPLRQNDPLRGAKAYYESQQGKVSPEQLWTSVVKDWRRIDKEPPSFAEFLAMLGHTTTTADPNKIRERKN
jgi:hypothetical protein